MAALLEAAAADPEATLAPFRAEFDALAQLVAERGLEAGLGAVASEEERLAAVRRLEPRHNDMLRRKDEFVEKEMPGRLAEAEATNLHDSAKTGQVVKLAAGLRKKEAVGQLQAGT